MCLVGNKRAEIARVVPCENNFCTKYAYHLHFCGLQKLNTLNLRCFHPPLNPCNHFSTVLIKTNWYTISCKYESCTSLTEMIIPNSVNEISEGIFKGCTNLRRLIVEDGAEELQYCYYTSYYGRPFSGTSLETLYLGRNLVNDSPFSFIESLKDVTIGNSVERISNDAFYGCTGLTEITIPNSVTEIGHESFRVCI